MHTTTYLAGISFGLKLHYKTTEEIITSYILLFLGFCVMLHSLWGCGLLLLVCLVWFGNRIAIEEQMLAERFGEEYQSYCQQTKRLFPYIY
jgi:protein-S-isoprenylcysteine O-methyltransferase Ste14